MRVATLAAIAALLACAGPSSARADRERPARSGQYSLEITDESGAVLPTFWHGGRTYVLGSIGQRYLVRVRNASGRRVEAVVSVDGRDVVDGRPASWEKRGYLVEPRGEVAIDGYRLSMEAIAAFRFSSVPQSYASRMGDARDVGVIGVAVFPERAAQRGPPLAIPERAPSADSRAPGAPEPSGEASAGSPAPGTSGKALREERRGDRPGLGTEFAEEHGSRAPQSPYERASARPDAVLTVRYDDRQGLLARGIDVYRGGAVSSDEAWLRETADPFRRNPFAEPPPRWR
jgi:hypothetical protein